MSHSLSPGIPYSPEATRLTDAAINEANTRKHRFVIGDHLLYLLCNDEATAEFLTEAGINIEAARKEMKAKMESIRRIPEVTHTEPAQSYKEMLAKASEEAEKMHAPMMTPELLFIAICSQAASRGGLSLGGHKVGVEHCRSIFENRSKKIASLAPQTAVPDGDLGLGTPTVLQTEPDGEISGDAAALKTHLSTLANCPVNGHNLDVYADIVRGLAPEARRNLLLHLNRASLAILEPK